MSRTTRTLILALTVAGLGLAAAPSPARADIPTPLVGRWVAQVPGGTLYFQYLPGFAYTPDGGVVGRFDHGVLLQGGAYLRSQGNYSVRQVGPNLLLIILHFDDGHVVTITDQPLDWTRMVVQHGPLTEVYFRQP